MLTSKLRKRERVNYEQSNNNSYNGNKLQQQEQQCQQCYDNKAQDDVGEQTKMLLSSKIGRAITGCGILVLLYGYFLEL